MIYFLMVVAAFVLALLAVRGRIPAGRHATGGYAGGYGLGGRDGLLRRPGASVPEAEGVRYVRNEQGQITDVMVPIEVWQRMGGRG